MANEKQYIEKYLPDMVKNIREFKGLALGENPEIENLWNGLDGLMNNQYVKDADEVGVQRLEKMLKITPRGTDDMTLRKFRILSRLNEQPPYTYKALENQLKALCGEEGFTMELDENNYKIMVRVALDAKRKFYEVDALLKRVVPANMVIDLSILYNQHSTLASFTHNQLGSYTHDQLRNEVVR